MTANDRPGAPSNSIDLVVAILGLDGLPPVERARAAAALIQPAQQILGAIRREAIYQATRNMAYQEVAEQLDVKETTINVAVSDHKRAERPTHQYGRFLAVAHAAAELAGDATNGASIDRYAKLERKAMTTPTEYGTLVKEIDRWLDAVERHDQIAAAAMRSRVRVAEVPILLWVTTTQRHLTLAERTEVIQGYGTTVAAQQGAASADD